MSKVYFAEIRWTWRAPPFQRGIVEKTLARLDFLSMRFGKGFLPTLTNRARVPQVKMPGKLHHYDDHTTILSRDLRDQSVDLSRVISKIPNRIVRDTLVRTKGAGGIFRNSFPINTFKINRKFLTYTY